MNHLEERTRPHSPRAARSVSELLDEIRAADHETFEKALLIGLQQMSDIQQALNDFKQVFVVACEEHDPVTLLAAIQAYHDAMVPVLASRDEHLGHLMKRPSENVARGVDRLSEGKFRILRDEGGMFHGSEVMRVLTAELREVASAALEKRQSQDPGDEVDSILRHIGDGAKTSGPRIP